MVFTKEAKEIKGHNKLENLSLKDSIIRDKKIKSYYSFLTDLFLDLVDGPKKISLKLRLEKAKLPTWLSTIMVNEGIIKKIGGGPLVQYDWANKKVEPNDEMAEKLMEAFIKASKKSVKSSTNKKIEQKKVDHIIKTQKLVPIDRTRLVEDHLNKREIVKLDNIKDLLTYMHLHLNGVQDPIHASKLKFREEAEKRGLSSYTLSSIINLGFLEKFGDRAQSSYLWKSGKPTVDMAHQVLITERGLIKKMILPVDVKQTKEIKQPMTKELKQLKKQEKINDSMVEAKRQTTILVNLAKKLIQLKEFDTALEVLNNIE